MSNLRLQALVWFGMVICVVIVVALSYWPFEIELPSRAKIIEALSSSALSFETPIIVTVVERIPFFVFFALLIGSINKLAKLKIQLVFWAVGTVVFIEAAQLFFIDRHARWSDIVLAIIACLSGLALGPKMRRLATQRNRVAAASLSAALLILGALVVQAQSRELATLDAWDCGFEVGIGNEVELTRPWSGTLWSADVFTPFNQVSLFPTDLEDAPLKASTKKRYKANALPLEICEDIKSARAFSIQASIESSGEPQTGPARIISWSKSIYVQNFMLGEETGHIHFRVITGQGSSIRMTEIQAPIPADTGAPFTARGQYSNGRITLSINGEIADHANVSDIRLNGGFSIARSYLACFMILLALFLIWDAIDSAITLRSKRRLT